MLPNSFHSWKIGGEKTHLERSGKGGHPSAGNPGYSSVPWCGLRQPCIPAVKTGCVVVLKLQQSDPAPETGQMESPLASRFAASLVTPGQVASTDPWPAMCMSEDVPAHSFALTD